MISAIIFSNGSQDALVRSLSTLVEGITYGVLRRVIVAGPEDVRELAEESGCQYFAWDQALADDDMAMELLAQLPAGDNHVLTLSGDLGADSGWSVELEAALNRYGSKAILRFNRPMNVTDFVKSLVLSRYYLRHGMVLPRAVLTAKKLRCGYVTKSFRSRPQSLHKTVFSFMD